MTTSRRLAAALALVAVVALGAAAAAGVVPVDGVLDAGGDGASATATTPPTTPAATPSTDGTDGTTTTEATNAATTPSATATAPSATTTATAATTAATTTAIPASELDDDGLDVATERELGTDPTVADTDGDGLDDDVEVNEYGTDPTVADTDGDRYPDGREVEAGTDPLDPDTDGDGLRDGVEAATRGPLADADPLRRDVFVELDYMRGQKPDPDAIALVVDEFADAPVANPDGSRGITLHVVVDDRIPTESRTTPVDLLRLRSSHFDDEGRGYHHAVVVANAESGDESLAGFAATGYFVFQTSDGDDDPYSTRGQAHVFMHELGHSMGLLATTYDGIDSRTVPYDDYRSAMNYDSPWESVRFSDDGAFDDWAYLEANAYTPPTLPWRLPGPPGTNRSRVESSAAGSSTLTVPV